MKIKRGNKLIWFLVVIVLLLLLNGYSSKKNKLNYSELTEEEIIEEVNEEINDMQVGKLSSMSERDRMEYYVSRFRKHVRKTRKNSDGNDPK